MNPESQGAGMEVEVPGIVFHAKRWFLYGARTGPIGVLRCLSIDLKTIRADDKDRSLLVGQLVFQHSLLMKACMLP